MIRSPTFHHASSKDFAASSLFTTGGVPRSYREIISWEFIEKAISVLVLGDISRRGLIAIDFVLLSTCTSSKLSKKGSHVRWKQVSISEANKSVQFEGYSCIVFPISVLVCNCCNTFSCISCVFTNKTGVSLRNAHFK